MGRGRGQSGRAGSTLGVVFWGLQMVSGIQPGESGKQLNMAVYTGVWSLQCTCIIQLYTYTGVLAETLRLPMALIHRYQML